MFQWGGNKSLLAVNSGETVIILNEQVMNAHYNNEVRNTPNDNYQGFKKLFFSSRISALKQCSFTVIFTFYIDLSSVTVSAGVPQVTNFGLWATEKTSFFHILLSVGQSGFHFTFRLVVIILRPQP